jgi:hypothetical protein
MIFKWYYPVFISTSVSGIIPIVYSHCFQNSGVSNCTRIYYNNCFGSPNFARLFEILAYISIFPLFSFFFLVEGGIAPFSLFLFVLGNNYSTVLIQTIICKSSYRCVCHRLLIFHFISLWKVTPKPTLIFKQFTGLCYPLKIMSY